MLTISSFATLKQTCLEKPLSAVDQSGLHCFNDYILPLRDINIHAIRVDSSSVRTVKGARTMFKDNQPVETVPLGKSLENFLLCFR